MRVHIAASVLGGLLTLATTTIAFAASPPPTTCKTASARYEMVGAPSFTAGFRPEAKRSGWLTDVAFFVRSAASGKTYWFLFDRGSARYVNMISTTDPAAPGWDPPDPDG